MAIYSFNPRAVNINKEYLAVLFLSGLYGFGTGVFLGIITGLPQAPSVSH